MKRMLKISVSVLAILLLLYYVPVLIIMLICAGIYDVSRNSKLDLSVARQYFSGNGVLTWMISPFNLLLDILSLPFINKGVYQLGDLPKAYQCEIQDLLDSADMANLISKLEPKIKGLNRVMFFFKWYGKNVESSIDIPEFHKEFKYIKTIGVSVFKERESTSRHFGPFRAMLRVLYSISEVKDDNVFIRVGKHENHWKDNKLFIFDDTHLHQSFNDSDDTRYCLFVDIVRPNHLNFLFNFLIASTRVFFKNFNGVFYKRWKMVVD